MGFAALRQFFVVLGEAAIPAEPRQRALDPPADRLDDEAHLLGQLSDDHDTPAEVGLDPILERASVGPIHPELFNARELLVRLHQHVPPTVPILDVGGMHQCPQQ